MKGDASPCETFSFVFVCYLLFADHIHLRRVEYNIDHALAKALLDGEWVIVRLQNDEVAKHDGPHIHWPLLRFYLLSDKARLLQKV